MSLFGKKKEVFEPPIPIVLTILLFVAAFVYALCFGNPYNGNSDKVNLENLAISCWIPGAFGVCVIIDFWNIYDKEMKTLTHDVFSILVGFLEFGTVVTALVFYWLKFTSDDASIQAPRIGAALVLLSVSLFSLLYRFMTRNGKSFVGENTLSNKSSLALGGSAICLALSLFPLAEYATYSSSSSTYFLIMAYVAGGVSIFMVFIALYFMEKPKSEEQNLCKTSLFAAIAAAFISAITLGISIMEWNAGLLVYQVFYWSIFSYLGLIVIFGAEAFYFGYVSNALAH